MPLPWLGGILRQTLASQRAHALLLHGPQGVGQIELALTLAQAWLCEAASPSRTPCGLCSSCKLVQAHSHPDLLVVIPEALQEPLGWGARAEDTASNDKAGKTKPSKDIKVEAVRAIVSFAQTTSARAKAKAVVVHPAERMNVVAANTLLKTLEEPAGSTRFVLSCANPDALLPTVRSRCQGVAMPLPPTALAIEWLAGQGVRDAEVMLAAAGGQPQEALEWFHQGIGAELWLRLPALVRRGEAGTFSAWPLPRIVNALQKICHDAACIAVGAAPRYFPAASIGRVANGQAWTAWMGDLRRVARDAEHPWNVSLTAEALVLKGKRAFSASIGP